MQESKLKRFLFVFFIAAITTYILYLLPFNSEAEPLTNSREIRKCLISILWLTFYFSLSLKFSITVRSIMVIALLMPSAISAFAGIVYKLPLTASLMTDIIESKSYVSEFSNFFSFDIILSIILIVLFFVGIAFCISAKLSENSFYKSKKSLIIFLILTIVPVFFAHMRDSVYPMKNIYLPIHYYNQYVTNVKPYLELINKQESTIRNYSQEIKPIPNTDIFLHIGESVRADHLSLNGYSRETTPNLKKEEQKGNIVNFGSAISYAVSTRESVVGILTPLRVNESCNNPNQTFYNALNNFNIHTNVFFSSMVEHPGNYDTPVISLQQKCQNKVFCRERSFKVLPSISKAFEDCKDNYGIFSLYYGEGSHTPFTAYDYEKFEIFKPTSNGLSKDDRCINNYDNSIYATDAFISSVIDLLRNRNAIYIFTSDHGEVIGDDGLWVRRGDAINRKSCRYVPMVIWVSDRFKNENSEKYNILKNNCQRLKRVSHDHIYHTVLGLYNIITEYYDSKLDLFSQEASETDYLISSSGNK
ncbi:MAG: sulfatase-like hydrolase/transferase [Candidatus Riflebacteria bacterium]|nr:sulfatase-like hydrolase/transferase [Candidatus Riflebacteria bacterium]